MGSAALLIAGAAISAGSAIQQGAAAAEQAKQQQKILEQNALLAERQAQAERDAATDTAQKFEKEGRRLTGAQRVAYARGGVLTTEGTPLVVMEETRRELEEDRLNILREGFLRGAFRESEAFGLRSQGAAARARGKAAAKGSVLAAGGSILTGASRFQGGSTSTVSSGRNIRTRTLPSSVRTVRA